jgi:hypothetical protein
VLEFQSMASFLLIISNLLGFCQSSQKLFPFSFPIN